LRFSRLVNIIAYETAFSVLWLGAGSKTRLAIYHGLPMTKPGDNPPILKPVNSGSKNIGSTYRKHLMETAKVLSED